jgi:hypothetical protein
MGYTAISRARRHSQIKAITGMAALLRTGYIYKITSPKTDKVYVGSTFKRDIRTDVGVTRIRTTDMAGQETSPQDVPVMLPVLGGMAMARALRGIALSLITACLCV